MQLKVCIFLETGSLQCKLLKLSLLIVRILWLILKDTMMPRRFSLNLLWIFLAAILILSEHNKMFLVLFFQFWIFGAPFITMKYPFVHLLNQKKIMSEEWRMKQLLVWWHNKWESPSINPGLKFPLNRFQNYSVHIQIAFLLSWIKY